MNEPFESIGGHKLLAVQWIDTRRDLDGYDDPAELKEFTPATIWTVGFGFVLEQKVVLGAEYFPKSATQTEMYRSYFAIPRECVKQIVELSAKEGSDVSSLDPPP